MAVLIERAASTTTVRKILYSEPDGFTAAGGWSRADPVSLNKRPRIQADGDNALYLPLNNTTEAVNLRRIEADNADSWDYELDDPIGNNGAKLNDDVADAPDTGYEAFAVAFRRDLPNYDEQIDTLRPEVGYLTFAPRVTGHPAVAKFRLIDRDLNPGSPRANRIVVVSGGTVSTIDRTAEAGSQVSTPTNGTDALDAAGQFLDLVTYFGQVFMLDGQTQLVYRPRTNDVVPWAAETAGSVPTGQRLMDRWNGRLVLAGAGHQWFMSAIGNGYDWDFSPTPQRADQAVSGADSRAGAAPDIVTALVPWSDDLLLFGCDASIHRMTGDPLRDGRFDLVTDETGMAFGSSWCKDDRGTVYFLGSMGGVWALSPGGQMQDISRGRIEDLLRNINYATTQPRMVWNQQDRTVHLYVVEIPAADGSVAGAGYDHYVYERDVQAWHVDRFSGASVEPHAAFSVDGDEEGDRRLLLGCADGYLREWDRDAGNDDSAVIISSVLIGPVQPRSTRSGGVRHQRPSVTLSPDSDTVSLALFASDDPHTIGEAVATRDLSAGHNRRLAMQAKGRYAWFRLSNTTGGRFAIDGMSEEPVFVGR